MLVGHPARWSKWIISDAGLTISYYYRLKSSRQHSKSFVIHQHQLPTRCVDKLRKKADPCLIRQQNVSIGRLQSKPQHCREKSIRNGTPLERPSLATRREMDLHSISRIV